MTEFKKEKQIETRVCTEMLRRAFHNLRVTEQFYQISHNEVASAEWKHLLERIKTWGFYDSIGVRCAVFANISDYIQEIEKIRLKVFEEGYNRKYS